VLVWFALLVAIALQTSFLSPPVGFALFDLKGVCPPEVKLADIYKGVIRFIILQLATLRVVIKWPEFFAWRPSVKRTDTDAKTRSRHVATVIRTPISS
jgi:TRAP-type mannitol/chloroaromatic compound transport system permease large subunit